MKIRHAIPVLLAATALSACATNPALNQPKVPLVKNADDLGSINVAVVGAEPWEDVESSFETKFALSDDDALEKAIPVTSSLADRLLDVFSAQFAANFAGPSIDNVATDKTSSNSSSDTDADGLTATTASSSSSSESSKSRSRKTPDRPALPANSLTPGQAVALVQLVEQRAQINAATRFRAAAALKQEVVSLNRAVQSAVGRTGYIPVMVRLQIGVQPRVRRQPFDARVRLSFLPKEGLGARMPVVVPLLATDNLDATQEQYAAEQLRQAALSLGGFSGPIAASLGLNKGYDRRGDTFALRLNSRYSVGVANENTLMVRIGAAQYGNELELVPQAINSTVLLLVPAELAGQQIHVVSRPSFNNALTGESLRLSSRKIGADFEFPQKTYELYCKEGVSKKACTPDLLTLTEMTRDNSGFDEFAKKIRTFNATVECKRFNSQSEQLCARDMWVELQRNAEEIWITSTSTFEVPMPHNHLLPQTQTAVYTSDKTRVRFVLGGADSAQAFGLEAKLYAEANPPAKQGKTKPAKSIADKPCTASDAQCDARMLQSAGLQATAITFSGKTMTVGFPKTDPEITKGALCLTFTPPPAGVDTRAKENDNVKLAEANKARTEQVQNRFLSPKSNAGEASDRQFRCYPIAKAAGSNEPESAEVTLAAGAKALTPIKGSAIVRVAVGWNDTAKGAALKADNGDIVGGKGFTMSETDYEAEVTTKGRLILELEGINNPGTVTITAVPLDKDRKKVPGAAQKLQFYVVPEPKPTEENKAKT